MLLEQAEINLLFENGVLTKALVIEDPLNRGTYHVNFERKGKPTVQCSTFRDKDVVREFKSLNAATNFAMKIGFRKMELHLCEVTA